MSTTQGNPPTAMWQGYDTFTGSGMSTAVNTGKSPDRLRRRRYQMPILSLHELQSGADGAQYLLFSFGYVRLWLHR